MADNHDALIRDFCDVTGADPQTARHLLEASSWNPETAAAQFFEGGDDPMVDPTEFEEEDDDVQSSHPAAGSSSGGPSSSAPKSKAKAPSRFATLGDLRNAAANDDDESDDERPQEFFAGGDKSLVSRFLTCTKLTVGSGLAVQDPNDRNRGASLIQDILKRGENDPRRREPEDDAGPVSRFSGTGHTLGSDESPSIAVPDPNSSRPQRLPTVTRTLTFWRLGFSIEDGPLMPYDDPANQEILRSIHSGQAPHALMGVEPGQLTDVNIFRRTEEDYQPPKKPRNPFSGAGQRLGAPVPGEVATPSTTAPPPAAAVPAAAATTSATPAMAVDSSAPTTQLQIRLGDGTRLVSRFNHTHTVGDIYRFVNASSVSSRSRDYVLQTTFPNKEYKEHGQTLKEAGLINAVVVQKWK